MSSRFRPPATNQSGSKRARGRVAVASDCNERPRPRTSKSTSTIAIASSRRHLHCVRWSRPVVKIASESLAAGSVRDQTPNSADRLQFVPVAGWKEARRLNVLLALSRQKSGWRTARCCGTTSGWTAGEFEFHSPLKVTTERRRPQRAGRQQSPPFVCQCPSFGDCFEIANLATRNHKQTGVLRAPNVNSLARSSPNWPPKRTTRVVIVASESWPQIRRPSNLTASLFVRPSVRLV